MSYQSIFHKSEHIFASEFKFAVFPLVEGQKNPATNSGWKDATTDLGVINRRRLINPRGNIGVATGSPSNLVVLDVDNKVEDGFASLLKLERKFQPLPPTPRVLTPSGGFHVYFRPRNPIGNRVAMLPGLDFRGDGGYVVAPPSVIGSKKYQFEADFHLRDIEIAAIPEWLEALVIGKQAKAIAKEPDYWSELFDVGAKEGSRNEKVGEFAGYLFRRYVHPPMVLSIIQLWNSYRNQPPLERGEVERVVNSIAKREAARRERGEQR